MPNGPVSSSPGPRCFQAGLADRVFRNLMAKDDFKNLGFAEPVPKGMPKLSKEPEKGVKGELQW